MLLRQKVRKRIIPEVAHMYQGQQNGFRLSANFENTVLHLDDWISQSDAARLRGVSRQAIGKLVKKGRLRSITIGGHILVHRVDVEAFEPRSAGRPSKKEHHERSRTD